MTLVGVIDSFATGTYTVTRSAEGDHVRGRYVPSGQSSTFEIDAVVEPTGGRDLLELPEGQQTSETRTVLTATELQTRSVTHEPDLIDIDGESWEIIRAERHQAFGGVHFRAFAQRVSTE